MPASHFTLGLPIGVCGTSFRFCARCCRQPLPQHRNASISCIIRLLRLSLSGAAALHFAFACDAAASHFLNTGMLAFLYKTHTLALPIGGCGTSFRLCTRCCRLLLPQHRNASNSFIKRLLWLSLFGAAAHHFAFVRDAAASHFLNTGILAFPI